MKNLKRKFTGRIALIAVAILLLLTSLVGCGGGAVVAHELKITGSFTIDNKVDGAPPTLLEQIAYMIQSAYAKETSEKAEYTSYEMLVAANRGYDMLAEGFKDEGDFPVLDPENKDANVQKNIVSYAIKVIENANTKATDKTLTTSQMEEVKKTINSADVQILVDAFKAEITGTDSDFWSMLYTGIGTVLSWMTVIGFGNYIVGICIFAILVEILMIPFGIKQQKNSIKQAKLRPKEMAIKNKYKGRNDQPTMQKMQAEIQELYQRENFSPASGCLPLLVQLPIIMVLYQVVMDPLRFVLGQSASVANAVSTFASTARAAGGLGLSFDSSRGSIELLSKLGSEANLEGLQSFDFYHFGDGVMESLQAAWRVPNFNIGPINFGLVPTANGWGDWMTWVLLLVPVLTFLTYFISSKLNRKLMYQSVANAGMDARQAACSNSMMDITMPAMSAFFTLAVPAVIGVYWAFRSWVTLLKSFILSKAMPLPTFTEEDYKAAAKEMAGKKTTKKSSNAGKVRSLHYIDDEDFEDTRERGLARRAAIEEREREEQETKVKNTPFGAARMKEDRRTEPQASEEAPVEATEEATAEAPAEVTEQIETVDAAENEALENDNDKDEV